MKTIWFVNLTNGIELIHVNRSHREMHFTRIQSTHCEQKLWNHVIQSAGADLLTHAALGFTCIVLDCGAKHPVPRAIWQGLEFIKYAMHRAWLNNLNWQPSGRSKTSLNYFSDCYAKLDKKTIQWLKYFKDFMPPNMQKIDVHAMTEKSSCDGKKNQLSNMLRSNYT